MHRWNQVVSMKLPEGITEQIVAIHDVLTEERHTLNQALLLIVLLIGSRYRSAELP